MEWGAAELYRLTKERGYLSDAKRYARLAAAESWMGRETAGHYQYYPFMNVGHFRLFGIADAKTKKMLVEYYRSGIDAARAAGGKNPYRFGVPFLWCSNNLAVALATQALMLDRMSADAPLRSFSLLHGDWLLGRNPWGTSMFTELPQHADTPVDPHLMTNAVYQRKIRGGLVDGPVKKAIFQSLKGVKIQEPDPYAPFQDDRAVYHDDIGDYSTNEPTMDGTASAILLWALLATQ